jgi:O-methyltransferase involved in polyketide biosynthesis
MALPLGVGGVDICGAVQATAYLAAAGRAEIDPYAGLFLEKMTASARVLAASGRSEVLARTKIIDLMLLDLLKASAGVAVVNVGAGLCTRPYRLDLSACSEAIEIDALPVLEFKDTILSEYQASCPLSRVPGDARSLPRLPTPAIVLTEGLLVYLTRDEIASLAISLAAQPGPVDWLADIVSSDSAEAMKAYAAQSDTTLPLSGLDSLEIFEQAGWSVHDYRALPVMRPPIAGRPHAGRASHRIVDGVIHLRRP